MVEFKLTKEQLLAKELFRSFAENEIKPISRDMDEEIWSDGNSIF